jgi:hypothetical protein
LNFRRLTRCRQLTRRLTKSRQATKIQWLSHFGFKLLTYKCRNMYSEAGSCVAGSLCEKAKEYLNVMHMCCCAVVRRRRQWFAWKVFYGTGTRTPKIRKCWGHPRTISAPGACGYSLVTPMTYVIADSGLHTHTQVASIERLGCNHKKDLGKVIQK